MEGEKPNLSAFWVKLVPFLEGICDTGQETALSGTCSRVLQLS